MVVKLKDAADRYELLEKESQAKAADLKKAMVAAKEARSKIRAAKEELRQVEISRLGSPFFCGRSSEIRSMPLWINYGVLQMRTWTWQ